MASAHITLQRFDSDDNWKTYSEHLEQCFAVNQIPEDQKVGYLLAGLSPPVYRILRDSCDPDEPRFKTYTELSKLMETDYPHGASISQARINFDEAVQTNDETVNQWLTRIMNLAVFCDFGNLLDSKLKEKFVSGLADHRIASRLLEENDTATLRHMVNVALKKERILILQDKKQPGKVCSGPTNILDIPDEILVKVFLYLNARERVPLGNSCRRFNNLVFENEELLRYLDFSKEGRLTVPSDIKRYFENKNAVKHIRRINLRNVTCIELKMLHQLDTAINLAVINIEGTPVKDISQLTSFLNMFQSVRRLSIVWEIKNKHEIYLEGAFRRLMCLSVTLEEDLLGKFITALQLCQQLKELHLVVTGYLSQKHSWNQITTQVLESLEVVSYRCNEDDQFDIRDLLLKILPNLRKWTLFESHRDHTWKITYHLEKNIDACEEIIQSLPMYFVTYLLSLFFSWAHPVHNSIICGPSGNEVRYISLRRLLDLVVRITHKNVPPQEFCCFSDNISNFRDHVKLKMYDAKRLLKNPWHQISSLRISHNIDTDCDVHLIASAFPNLTELILHDCFILSTENSGRTYLLKRLWKRGSPVPEKEDEPVNLYSSFELLVKNTPHLKHLKIINVCSVILYPIQYWKRLETLCLRGVSIRDMESLIQIGRQCKDLRQLELANIRSADGYLHKEVLLEMLSHCQNLRDFSIYIDTIAKISEMFTALHNNKQLERVRCWGGKEDSIATLTSSIDQLLHQCSKLTTFIFELDKCTSDPEFDELSAAVRGWTSELGRPNLQIQINFRNDCRQIGAAQEDTTLYDDN